ncbi:hypothetical protein AC578_8065 [Pseudocercospora eumusae]|uniref:Zn(2)-C6 fungal-type domain-containing protein n=1 Tax=Pseudocercospora eumusae TaxID=321146 RepID=A0A139H7M8_9PEZI|nr:hypothetical protein AC578_8065 [Pseudocercospora eumusae]
MPAKLKSRSGCLTCVTRKKKCDEAKNGLPPKCGHCFRLGLACVWRSREQAEGSKATTAISISTTNLKAKSPPPRLAVSNGYPSFRNDFEKQLILESSRLFQPLVCATAGPGFEELTLLARFCTQSQLVRDAVVAFAAHGQASRSSDAYKLSLTSYQSCVAGLRRGLAYGGSSPAERDQVLAAIFFLGSLESLKFGVPSHYLAHFEMCRRLLLSRLSGHSVLQDQSLIKLYRMIAEAVTYTIATSSQYSLSHNAQPVGQSFKCLFPGDDYSASSPFLGGVHKLYHIMFEVNTLLRPPRADQGPTLSLKVAQSCAKLWGELDELEGSIETLYATSSVGEEVTRLYKVKHQVAILALRVHLIKISRPSAIPTDPDIRFHLASVIEMLAQQDVREPGNPALRWPLIILACAAETDHDFQFLSTRMHDMAAVLDPVDSRKLVTTCFTLGRYRHDPAEYRHYQIETCEGPRHIQSQLDFLLEPRLLDANVYPHLSEHESASPDVLVQKASNTRIEEI